MNLLFTGESQAGPGVECHTLRVALSLVRWADRSGRGASGVGGAQLPVTTEKKGIKT